MVAEQIYNKQIKDLKKKLDKEITLAQEEYQLMKDKFDCAYGSVPLAKIQLLTLVNIELLNILLTVEDYKEGNK